MNKNFIINEQNVESYVQKIGQWIREKVQNAGANGVVLGMSGGIDCSVVARICQVANIPIHLIMMPYGDNMEQSGSMTRCMELINKYGFGYHTHDIKVGVDSAIIPAAKDISIIMANLRPRERTQYIYQYAQLHDMLVIGTTNLAEYMLGYFTKWGDASDINPLQQITKREVYVLAKHLGVPQSIIDQKPSAELWEGQTDEDELGMTYDQIDDYLLGGTSGSAEVDRLIEIKIASSKHKRESTMFFF